MNAEASPKSAIRRCPSWPNRRLAGLTSRWTIPWAWAWSRARQASRKTDRTCDGLSVRPLSRMLRRLPPARYSVTR